VVNPMTGSGMQQARAVEGGVSRRGGAKPRGRNAGATGRRSPKGAAETRIPGAGLFDVTRWTGDLWTNPREEVQPKGWAAWIGTRRESRRQGQEGRVRTHSRVAHPGRKGLEGSRARRKVVPGKPRRGAVKPDTAESTRGDPPVEGPRRVKRTARNRLAARKRSPIGERVAMPPKGCTRMQWPLGEGSLERAERRVRP
jgi:hypothetical protein